MKFLKRVLVILCCVTLLCGLCACGASDTDTVATSATSSVSQNESSAPLEITGEIQVETSEDKAALVDESGALVTSVTQDNNEDSQISENQSVETEVPEEVNSDTANYQEREVGAANLNMGNGSGRLVVIDAGHQGHGNSEQEPIGPGASETKPKVATGTEGCVTGIHESELNLAVSLKLQRILESRGYRVMMVRTSQDVNISNSERAQIANQAGADCFIRVHANSDTDSSVNGAITICQTASNPFNGNIYSQCRALSEYCLDGVVNATGCAKGYIWETDDMSGINWCSVPVTIVEMGYMSNPSEDQLLAQDDYREKVAQGIANGVDAYFASR